MSKYQCDNCDFQTDNEEQVILLCDVDRLFERLETNSIIPFGACPECDCFVYLHDAELRLWDARRDLLASLKGLSALWDDHTVRSEVLGCVRSHERATMLQAFANARNAIAKAKGEPSA